MTPFWLALFLLAQPAGPDAAKGKLLFQSCSGCHNIENDLRKMGPSLRSLFGKVTLRNGKHADDANVREIILDGYNGMPSFRYSFRPAEIDDLMAYLHTLNAKPAVAPQIEAGEQYFKAYCIRCHDSAARTSSGPDLRGRFTVESVKIVEEGHAGAPPIGNWLDENARRELYGYLKNRR